MYLVHFKIAVCQRQQKLIHSKNFVRHLDVETVIATYTLTALSAQIAGSLVIENAWRELRTIVIKR